MGVREDVVAWVDEHWSPDLTVREWWARLGSSGWAAPTWPVEWYGRGLSVPDAVVVAAAIHEAGALGPPGGVGMLLAGPTILTHGTDEQRRRYLPEIVCGRAGWCQLFSEPAAGSDLAGLQARAERTDDGWCVNGQKVWTSSGHVADLGMLLARTDPGAPKRRGITFFAVDMHAPGVAIRPLRELTGRSLFNEVFLTDVRIGDGDVVGELHGGWTVANTTLAHERSGLGAGAAGAVESAATAGSVKGHLDRRAGDFVRPRGSGGRRPSHYSVRPSQLVDAARRLGRTEDPLVRQALARLHIEAELGRYMAQREKALRGQGRSIPGAANIGKLRMSDMFRQGRDLGLALLGSRGMLHDYADQPTGSISVEDRALTTLALWAAAPPIYGGTDQIQRNIVAERVLGLPREAADDRDVPFRELPRNT